MRGFSLLEVMLALFIAGVLTALSVPVYTKHVIHQNRLAAETALMKVASALEQYYTEHNSYAGIALEELHFPPINKNYKFHINASPNRFILAAQPVNKQTRDTQCATLSINSQGEKKITGNGKLADCW
jgi:type IV pilus assembly protein PilE